MDMSDDVWVAALEQTMLYLLILGRWFIPRGDLTHDQLSQLLLVFIGMASDIMELFYLFGEDAVVNDNSMGYVILAVWTISLLQFTLVLTSTSPRYKRTVTHSVRYKTPATLAENQNDASDYSKSLNLCSSTEIWAILVSLGLQDVPFLIVRMWVGFGLHVFTFNLLFFTMKNVVVILVQAYRLTVVIVGTDTSDD